VLAHFMAERATKKDKELRRAFDLLATELERYESRRVQIEVDGRDVSGDYVLVSVLNLRSVGPALRLAPQARFDDGELDLVLIGPEHRAPLLAHLRRVEGEEEAPLPAFEHHRAKHVHLHGDGEPGTWAHVDDCSCALEGDTDVRIEPRAARFLVPEPSL